MVTSNKSRTAVPSEGKWSRKGWLYLLGLHLAAVTVETWPVETGFISNRRVPELEWDSRVAQQEREGANSILRWVM